MFRGITNVSQTLNMVKRRKSFYILKPLPPEKNQRRLFYDENKKEIG